MPYDMFVEAQIPGDLLSKGDRSQNAGLPSGSVSMASVPNSQTIAWMSPRGSLALTGACAQCHDHKFDPIPTKDYYSLQGVFNNTKRAEYSWLREEVDQYKDKLKKVADMKARISDFLHVQADKSQ